MNGIQPWTSGVRASTSSSEKMPAKIRETSPRISHAEVTCAGCAVAAYR